MTTFPPWIEIKDGGSLWLTEDDRDKLTVSYRLKEIIFRSNQRSNM